MNWCFHWLIPAVLALAASPSIKAQEGELQKLQGIWNIVSLEVNGQKTNAAPGSRVLIQGDHFSSQGMGAEYDGTIEVDPSVTPQALTFHFTGGPEKGNSSLGIYELNGDDLRICITTRGDVRPTVFASPVNSGLALEVLKHQHVSHDLGFDDTPMLPGLPFHVHDYLRPHPHVVTPASEPGGPPSDAVVLFDGKDLSNWKAQASSITRAGGAGNPEWKVENGYMEVVPKTGDIATREKFGDCQLHIEWSEPPDVAGTSQGRGNSGVILQGRYEIQVLDAYKNATYADGMAAAIYGQWPPLANVARKPGEWNVYDIVFEAPVFDGEKLVKPAYFTVFWNGVLVHNRKASMGPMVYRQVTHYQPQPAVDSLVLQNHNNKVRYRNIWIRPLGQYDEPEK